MRITGNSHRGAHEFFDLCGLLECEPYLCGNVGSDPMCEIAEWLQYITTAASKSATF